MESLIPFFAILVVGLFFSRIFARLHLPWVVALILGGIVIGPYGFNLIAVDQTIDFFAQVGLVFLMFMAGLEVRLRDMKRLRKEVSAISILNSLIPFVAGVAVALAFGLGWLAAVLVGIIFISSSVAVVVPSLEANGIIHTPFGKISVSTTVIQDVLSLVALSVFLQLTSPQTGIPLPLFYGLLVLALVFLRWAAPKVHWLFHAGKENRDNHEQELRVILVILLGTVIIFELLGLHGIIAGFFAGFVLAESLTHDAIREKLHILTYGLFIPIFFVTVGLKTDVSVFVTASGAVVFTVAIVAASVIAKFGSGWFASRLVGLSHRKSMIMGATTVPQLSTTLAAAFTAQELNLLADPIITALVALSIVTTVLSPIFLQMLVDHDKIAQTHIHT